MITTERLQELYDQNTYSEWKPFDQTATAINILRTKIPYDVCKNIIVAVEHDVIYLVSIKIACEYLDENDIIFLFLDCGVSLDSKENCCLFIYV